MKIKVAGKQIVLGEYAVLEACQRGLVMTINRFLTVSIEPSYQYSIVSDEFSEILYWTVENGVVSELYGETGVKKKTEFLRQGIQIALTYIEEKGLSLGVCKMEITSELKESRSGLKYGLGSSAALVVGVIKALLKFCTAKADLSTLEINKVMGNRKYEARLSFKDLLFRLGLIAHYKAQGNGSGIDVAASVYEGLILYESLDQEWILKQLEGEYRLRDLVEMKWPCGYVRHLSLPSDIEFLIGWTGEKADSKVFIEAYNKAKKDKPYIYNDFIERSNISIDLFIKACLTDNSQLIIKAIKEQRLNLTMMGKALGIEIETLKLSQLCDDFKLIGEAKLSGAGGGDCGIGFYLMKHKNRLPIVLDQWRKNGIIAIT